jgi:hypothetical protein
MQKKARWEPEDLDWVFKETSHIDQDLIRQVVSDHFDNPECDADMDNDDITKMILTELGNRSEKWKGYDGSKYNKNLKPVRTIYDMIRNQKKRVLAKIIKQSPTKKKEPVKASQMVPRSAMKADATIV